MGKGKDCKTWGNVGGWNDYNVSIVDPQGELKDRDGDDVSDCTFDSLLVCSRRVERYGIGEFEKFFK